MDVGVATGGGDGRWTVTKLMFTKQVGCVIGSEPETKPTERKKGSCIVVMPFN